MPAALFVVANAASLVAGDTATQTLLTNLGYTLTTISDETTPSFTGIDLVVLGASCDNPTLGTKYNATTIGVLALGGAEPHSQWSSASFPSAGSAVTQFFLTDAGSPINNGRSGLTTVYTASSTYNYYTTTALGTGVVKDAYSSSDTVRTIIGRCDTGGALLNSNTAPSRRTHFGVTSASVQVLNAAGVEMFGNAVTWTANLPAAPTGLPAFVWVGGVKQTATVRYIGT